MNGMLSLCSKTSKLSSPTCYSRNSNNDAQDTMAIKVKFVIDVVMTREYKSSTATVKVKHSKKEIKNKKQISLKDQLLKGLMALVEKHQE